LSSSQTTVSGKITPRLLREKFRRTQPRLGRHTGNQGRIP
jgi:hypothetical protein